MQIVSSRAMALAENNLISLSGTALAEEFMETVGKKLAIWLRDFLITRPHLKGALIVCGVGNNGGDAWVCGRILLEMGLSVRGLCVDIPEASLSQLCQKNLIRYRNFGGTIQRYHDQFDFSTLPKDLVILDGLFGTGFRGTLSGADAPLVQWINQSRCPVISIDIPSGVNGDTGTMTGQNSESEPVRSYHTIILGFPKIGLFLENGLNYAGQFSVLDFGIKKDDFDRKDSLANLIRLDDIALVLPRVPRCQHKYQAGFVLGYAGSPGMEGAASLSSLAALRSGSGLVKILSPFVQPELKASLPREILFSELGVDRKAFLKGGGISDAGLMSSWKRDIEKANALYLGPGIGRLDGAGKICRYLLLGASAPVILDADALTLLDTSWLKDRAPGSTVLTPHFGELGHLLGDSGPRAMSLGLMETCQAFAEKHRVILLVKGSPTFIFNDKGEIPDVMAWGDPGMATAGSGDVLTGLLASLASQGLNLKESVILAASIHGMAGMLAAKELQSRCLIASDLISYLPDVFRLIADEEYLDVKTRASELRKRLGH